MTEHTPATFEFARLDSGSDGSGRQPAISVLIPVVFNAVCNI